MPIRSHVYAASSLALATRAVLALPPVPETPIEASEPLNILMWVMDTTRGDHFGFLGYPRDTTPIMDALAEQGAYWNRATTTGSWTWPSVSSIMTSTAVPTHRNHDAMFALRKSLVALPDVLNAAGYHTSIVSSNYLIMGEGRQLETRFDEALTTTRPDARLTSVVIETLRDQSKRPFFIYAQPVACHTPYIAPEPFDSLFVDDEYYGHLGDLPGINDFDDCLGGMKRSDMVREITSMDWYMSQYDGLLAYMDAQVGQIFQTLEEEGLRENTLVVLTADHAENLAGEHNLYFCHADHFQSNIGVPLIILLPERLQRERGPWRGVELGGNPSHCDLMPTILDAIALPGPSQQMQGVSLLRTPEPSFRVSHNFYGRSATYGDQKIIQHGFPYVASEPTLLYDLANDPNELYDLAPAYPSRVERMEAHLIATSLYLESLFPPDTESGVFYASDFQDPNETDGYFHVPGKERFTGLVSWEFEHLRGRRRVLHGKVEGDEPSSTVFSHMSLIAEGRSDYSVATRILLVSGRAALSSSMAGTLVLDTQEIYQGYQLLLSEHSVELVHYTEAGDTLSTGPVEPGFSLGVWHDVRITNDGTEIRVVIDDEPVISGFAAQPAAWGATKLGLAKQSEALFDGLRTWRDAPG